MVWIVSALAATPQPGKALSIAFLFDFSWSVTNRDVESYDRFASATSGLVAGLKAGDSLRLGIVTNHLVLTPILTPAETARLPKVVPTVPDRDRYGPTPLWDQLYDAVTTIARDGAARAKTIIIVTDGRSTGNSRSFKDLVDHATRAGVSISSVGEDTLVRRPETRIPVDSLDNLRSVAASTGGVFLLGSRDADGMQSVMTKLLATLHSAALHR
jgi:hypothetical protein